MGTHGVALCDTITAVLRLEAELRAAGVDVKAIPTPRHLSSDCGSALRYPIGDEATVRETASRLNTDVEGYHALD